MVKDNGISHVIIIYPRVSENSTQLKLGFIYGQWNDLSLELVLNGNVFADQLN